MSLYSRGAMRPSSQSGSTWGPPPIFKLPPLNRAVNAASRPGSILDGSLFLPPSSLPENDNRSDLEMESKSEAELSDHYESAEVRPLSRTRADGSDSLEERGHSSIDGGDQTKEQSMQIFIPASKEAIPKNGYIESRSETHSDQGTGSDLERISPIRQPELDMISARARRGVQTSTSSTTRPTSRSKDGESPLSSVDSAEEDKSHKYPEPIAEESIFDERTTLDFYRGVPVPITPESLVIQNRPRNFRWPMSDTDYKGEIQAGNPGEGFSSSSGESVLVDHRWYAGHHGEATLDDEQSIYLTEIDEDEGGVTLGDVRTRYEELREIRASFDHHPIIRQWSFSKFMEEWVRDDGLIQYLLQLERRLGAMGISSSEDVFHT